MPTSYLPFPIVFSLVASWFVTGGDVHGGESLLVYIGTYTGGDAVSGSEGIYLFRMDLSTGELTPSGLAAKAENPSFLAVHSNGKHLYAVNEIGDFEGKKSGSVSAFSIDSKTGKLKLLNRRPSGGAGPCHLVVDRSGKNVLVANYGGGSVSVLRVEEDGRLGETTAFVQHEGSSVTRRQRGPHAHSIHAGPGNRFAFAADLGLDKILVYRFDARKGTLVANDPAAASLQPGAGPRHFAFHPGAGFAYVINELTRTVTAFAYDPVRGRLAELHTVSTVPEGFKEGSTAEVQVAPSGKFLYGSNRGHDSIVVFAIDEKTGKLTYVENESTQGKTPRNFGIDPTEKYLVAANQGSGNLVVLRIDPKTGALEPTGHVARAPRPVCVKFLRTRSPK